MTFFRFLCRLPGIGPILRIANAYAYQGDYRSEDRIASPRLWLKAFGPELVVSLILTLATMFQYICASWVAKEMLVCVDEFYCKPGGLAVAIIPSTLGFGIGVYALIFTLSAAFVKNAHEKIEEQKSKGSRIVGSELMLNTDLALPLLALVIALVVGVIQQAAPTSISLIALAWISLWFSILSLLGLISVIFGLADHSLLDKSK
jgi:hypothetical protein